VQVKSEDGSRSRGFVTRLSQVSACISSSPELVVGDRVELTIRRPADNQTVVLSAQVERQLDEGGLWRGRSAALVALTSPLDDHFLGADASPPEDVSSIPLRRGSEPTARTPYVPGRNPGAPLLSGLGRRRRASSKPRPQSAELEAPAPLLLQPKAIDSAALSVPSADGLGLSDSAGHLGALPDDASAEPLTIPDGPIILDAEPAPYEPSLDGLEPDESTELPPPVKDSADFWDDDSWDSDDSLESLHDSLIPRAARIPSGVPVHFWTRGKRFGATARNFSAEGMFLAYNGAAPSRGGAVRVEFAIGDIRPDAAIRFTAEVRWHHSDRPGSDLPEGFGVLISEFETPGDERSYSKLLLYLLTIEAPAPPPQD
jgi:hypothetical protein